MKVIDFQDASCKHCYKCVRHCQVKAISVKNEQAHIMEEHCIHCGHCLVVCPQNAKKLVSDLNRVKSYLAQGMKTVVSIAPSYLGVLEYQNPGQVVGALQRLGFFEVRETAEGASLVTKEYAKILQKGTMENVITTCCPSVNDLIEKYYPTLTSQMAPVVSPMIAHGRLIKQIHGTDVKVVFLGPCIAKKQEAMGDERVEGAIDAILTFEEVVEWLEEENVRIKECKEEPMGNVDPGINRLYPLSSGVIQSVMLSEGSDLYQKIFVDGLEACLGVLDSIQKGEVTRCFIEANVCEGGCARGPGSSNMQKSFISSKLGIEQHVTYKAQEEKVILKELGLDKTFYSHEVVEELPTDKEMEEILRFTGKYSKGDELNCGACGYSTCRSKAIAVFQKKAELGMCMPYALAQAESMANVVLDATPNMIFIVGKDMKIRECNKQAQKFLGIGREEALERYMFEFVEIDDIVEVLEKKEPIFHKKIEWKQSDISVEETIVYIEDLEAVLIIYDDVTKEEQKREQHYHLKMETVEMAQKVIDKQMMVAQEIAGLLGETTAETKVTLTKLRDSILFEGEEE